MAFLVESGSGKREKERVRLQLWRADNPEKSRETGRKYREANREKESARWRRWSKTPLGQLRRLSDKTARRLQLGTLGRSKLLGYTRKEFIAQLESTLSAGMTFEEAKAEGYHVDHFVPLSFFNIFDTGDNRTQIFRALMDLRNLRLISAEENLSKNDRVDLPGQHELFVYLQQKYLMKEAA